MNHLQLSISTSNTNTPNTQNTNISRVVHLLNTNITLSDCHIHNDDLLQFEYAVGSSGSSDSNSVADNINSNSNTNTNTNTNEMDVTVDMGLELDETDKLDEIVNTANTPNTPNTANTANTTNTPNTTYNMNLLGKTPFECVCMWIHSTMVGLHYCCMVESTANTIPGFASPLRGMYIYGCVCICINIYLCVPTTYLSIYLINNYPPPKKHLTVEWKSDTDTPPPHWNTPNNTTTSRKLLPGHLEIEFKYKHALTTGKIWVLQLHYSPTMTTSKTTTSTSVNGKCVLKIYKQASKAPADTPSVTLLLNDYVAHVAQNSEKSQKSHNIPGIPGNEPVGEPGTESMFYVINTEVSAEHWCILLYKVYIV